MAAKADFINQLAAADGRRAAHLPVRDRGTVGFVVSQQPHVNYIFLCLWRGIVINKDGAG